MNHFRRSPVPAPTPAPPSRDGWAATRVEPASSQDGWAPTRVEAAASLDGWAPTRVDARVDNDGWGETRAQTALATRRDTDADDSLAAQPQDIGRPTGADTRELFVSCDAAEALQQQFEHLQPEFIAIHDIATASSRRLLEGVAVATSRRVQTLVIRRQGYGTPLASLAFVDVPTEQGKTLRLYSTDAAVDAEPAARGEPAARAALARTLLGFSRLGVIMVGELRPSAIAEAFKPLADAIADDLWHNRQLLLLPLAAASALASQGIALGQTSGVAVRTTPQVLRPSDAWRFIAASWSRIGEPLTAAPAPASARPMPTVEPAADLLERYLRQLGDIAGLLSCCIFDVTTGQALAHAGADIDGTQLALHGGQMLAAMGAASRSFGFGRTTPDAAITLGTHHLLLRGVPKHPALALHAVLDKHVANLTLARLQLQRMDTLFDAPAA